MYEPLKIEASNGAKVGAPHPHPATLKCLHACVKAVRAGTAYGCSIYAPHATSMQCAHFWCLIKKHRAHVGCMQMRMHISVQQSFYSSEEGMTQNGCCEWDNYAQFTQSHATCDHISGAAGTDGRPCRLQEGRKSGQRWRAHIATGQWHPLWRRTPDHLEMCLLRLVGCMRMNTRVLPVVGVHPGRATKHMKFVPG